MKYAVITGSNGFLGRALVELLCKNDYIVYCIDNNFDFTNTQNTNNKILIKCNIENINSLNLENEPDLFYHLAWEGVSSDKKNDYCIQHKNISLSIKCFEFAHKIGSKRFIAIGSTSEYAYNDTPIDGYSLSPAPCDHYSATKASTHIYLELMAKKLKMDYVRILLPSIYGGHRDDANIITYTIKTLLAKEKPSYTKLEQIWEYVYIEDAVRALLEIGEKGLSLSSYPVGWGERKKLLDYILIIRDYIDKDLELGIGDLEYKTGWIDNCIINPKKTIDEIGYKPRVDFKTGIIETIEYFRGKMRELNV